ncbi:MAG: hypothetical protein LCH58_07975 [Bacteroidetes bacterium]|uniref:HYC_CC_PP family protein n=1 Tax=Phnomibacter sp. TaxID=2836217 RepID=UPI002FDDE1A3|nr:hypothetical protein [Bacteroidota bacterium]
MKKLLTILLLSLYGLSVSGMSVHLHYCCGKVAGMSIGYEKQTEKGCKHGMKKTMPGCCIDDQINIDTDDNQGSAHTVAVPEVPVALLQHSFATITVPVYNSNSTTNAAIRGSPPLHTVPLYLANCVFRN